MKLVVSALVFITLPQLLVCRDSLIYDRFFYRLHFGHYNFYNGYSDDTPKKIDYYSDIPFGIPIGSFTKFGNGPPTGLMFYVTKYPSISKLWSGYYRTHFPHMMCKKHYYGMPFNEYLNNYGLKCTIN